MHRELRGRVWTPSSCPAFLPAARVVYQSLCVCALTLGTISVDPSLLAWVRPGDTAGQECGSHSARAPAFVPALRVVLGVGGGNCQSAM